MPALPTTVSKTALDQGSDDPAAARPQLASGMDAINSLIDYLTDLFGPTGVKSDARTTFGLGAAATAGVGDGLEIVGGLLRPKLNGASLARDTNGLAVAAAGVAITHIASQARGSLITFGAANAPAVLAPGTSGFFLKSNGAGADLSWGSVVSSGLAAIKGYTASGTYTKTANVRMVISICIGGGAGGANGSFGGGSGGISMKAVDVSSVSTVAVTVGGGGAPGGNGGTSSFGANNSATGGTSGGAGGAGVGGNINGNGQVGELTGGRMGGAGHLGFGAGGSPGFIVQHSGDPDEPQDGGAGQAGAVIVIEFL